MNEKSVVRGVELRADTAIKGLLTSLPASVTQITVGTVTYQVADLVKSVQGLVQPWKDARTARALLRQVIQDRPKDYQKLVSGLADLRIALAVILGRENEDLSKFGFKPQKRRKALTSEQKTMRAIKAKLTREKHHTMGRRQKEALGTAGTPSVTISSDGKVEINPSNGTEQPSPAPTINPPAPKP